MWLSFFLSYFFAACSLFIPGYLFIRGLGAKNSTAICCAPIYSIAGYVSLCIAYRELGIFACWELVLLPVLSLGFIVYFVRVVIAIKKRVLSPRTKKTVYSQSLVFLLYCSMGVLFTGLIFVYNLDGADSFGQGIDNAYHSGAIRMFLLSGNWSIIGGSLPNYNDLLLTDIASNVNNFFYPGGWYVVTALTTDAVNASVPVAANATTALFPSLVLPSGMYLFIRKVLSDNPKVQIFGALATCLFCAFPYRLYYAAMLIPYLTSLCLFPGAAVLSMAAIHALAKKDKNVVTAALLALIGCFALAVCHPSSMFSLILFTTIYSCHVFWRKYRIAGSHVKAVVSILIALALLVMIWIVFYKVPFMSNVLANPGGASSGLPQAIVNLFTLAFFTVNAQPLVGIFVLAGILYCISKRKIWYLIVYLAFATLFLISAVLGENSIVKRIITGFWYTHHYRLSPVVAMFAIPLCASGMYFLFQCLQLWIGKFANLELHKKPVYGYVLSVLFLVCVAGIVFLPSYSVRGYIDIETAFGRMSSAIAGTYNKTDPYPVIYDSDEREFVDSIKDVVSSNDLIINSPSDGSIFMFSQDTLNPYYRMVDPSDFHTEEAALIRKRLCALATDPEVQNAVRNLNAKYVIQLDYDNDAGHLSGHYFREDWIGIESIKKDTPGFELVMQKDDMRLYRIEDKYLDE